MRTKKCNTCKIDKPIDQFSKRLNGYQNKCKKCNKDYLKNYNPDYYKNNPDKFAENQSNYRKSNLKWYKELKKTLKCSKCPENDPACLEFHHLNERTKRFNIASSPGKFSREIILEEMSKCIILCSNCHKKLHYYQNRD